MSFYSIDGGLSDRNYDQILTLNNKIQKNSEKKYKKRKDFVLNQIKVHGLTLENLKKSAVYLDASKNLRAAFIYHLETKNKKKTKKVEVGDSAATFSGMLIDSTILCFEIIISIFSAKFYMDLGFNFYLAHMTSVCVELFFMSLAPFKQFKIIALRWTIFFYSVYTLVYSNILNDPALMADKTNITFKLNSTNKEIALLEDQLGELSQKKSSLLKVFHGYESREMYTVALTKVGPRLNEVQKQSDALITKIESKRSQLNELKTKQGKSSYLTLESLNKLQMGTIGIIVFFIIIQLGTLLVLPETSGFKNIKIKWGKPKKRRRAIAA